MILHLTQALLGCFKRLSWILLALLLSGCQITYLAENAYHQMSLLNRRTPIQSILEKDTLTEEHKQKLKLAGEASRFAEDQLHLTSTENYTTFVQLDQDYVTYVVNAAPKWELKSHLWWFPIVGSLPYKGYFNKEGALEEEERLKKKGLDTYVRGVSAYSTLGWFEDPILSSMLRYKNHHLVNTIIHETVHATLYIKGSADFNERLAVFLGNKGTELYYQQLEGENSPTLKRIQEENSDDKLFSEFISREIKALESWYKDNQGADMREEDRLARIKEIQVRFSTELAPQLKTSSYSYFDEVSLTNARLMLYNTYVADLTDFHELYERLGSDFQKFIEHCKSLEGSSDPEADLKDWLQKNKA